MLFLDSLGDSGVEVLFLPLKLSTASSLEFTSSAQLTIAAMKLSSPSLDVVGVYMSSDSNVKVLVDILKSLLSPSKSCVVAGDFNIDLFSKQCNNLTTYLTSQGFKQLVTKGTHLGGGLIDHCYVKIVNGGKYDMQVISKVYSDHDCLCFSFMPSQ